MAAGPLLQPVELRADALLDLHAAHPERYPALLESAAAGTVQGRYDILFACPGASLTLGRDGCVRGRSDNAPTFLAALDRWWQAERVPVSSCELPFHGGWLLYLGYELAGEIEPRLRLPRPSAGPVAHALRVPAAIVRECASGRAWVVAEPEAAASIPLIADDLRRAPRVPRAHGPLLERSIDEDDPERYLLAVRRALDYIAAGDTYQANLSRGWHATLRAGVQSHHLYRRLRRTNPGPFSGLAGIEDVAIVSSSPERLVEVRGGQVATRPIAGTRPRGADAASDERLARELHAHPKERAEHIMLIDLERNDLGRVCAAGSVEVNELMSIESYAHVHHIVSNVRGRLVPTATPGQVLAAVFPGGTITGCPKVRCMEIIAELEGVARGAYTGSLGYLNRDGSMDLNILIRSVEVAASELTLRAGAGVVADSIPERELEETRAKARGVLRALEVER